MEIKNKKPTGGSQFVGKDGLTHYQRNKQKYIDKQIARKKMLVNYVRDLKKKAVCKDCGLSDWRVLEFDHLPKYKKVFNISDTVKYHSIKQLDEEMAKCEIVCANCHRIRTYKRAGIV